MTQSWWLGRTITPGLITPTATSRCRPIVHGYCPSVISISINHKLSAVIHAAEWIVVDKPLKRQFHYSNYKRQLIFKVIQCNRAAGPDRPWCLFFKWFTDSHDSSVFKLLSECHCCITEELLRTSIRISLVRCQSDVETITLVPCTPYAMCRYGEHDFIFFGSHSIAKFAEFGPCALLFAHQKLLVYRGPITFV